MEFIDFIMATAIFFIVLVAVFVMVGNNLPNVHLQEDNFTSKNILSGLQNFTDVYYINSSLENTVTPYSLVNIDTTGKSNSLETVSNNTAYGVTYNSSKFYNYNGNTNYTSPGILIKKETFNDYNYQDTFTLGYGLADVNKGTLDLNINTSLETKDSFSNFNSFLNFKSTDLNVYFNYSDAQNTFLVNIQGTTLKLYKIESGLESLITNTTIDNNTWRTLNIKYSNNDLVSITINSKLTNYQNTGNLKSGKILIKTIDQNTSIGDFVVFKNTDVSYDTSSVATNDLNVTINNNISSIKIMEGSNNIATMDFNFPQNLTLNQGNIPIITDNNNRQIIFPDTNEFWTNLKTNEDLKINLSNLQQNNYDYYIEDDGVSYNLWLKVNIKANKTKTLYIEKINGYSPDGDKVFSFFDDFDGTSLDTSKWTEHGVSYGDINLDSGKLIISNISGSTSNVVGIHSNINYMTFGKILTTRTKLIEGRHATLIGYADSPYIAYPFGDSTTDGASWYGKESGTSVINLASGVNSIIYSGASHDSRTYFVYDVALISQNSVKFYRSNNFMYDDNISNTIHNQPLPVYYSAGGYTKPDTLNVDYIFVRKYTPTEPTVTITDMNTYYKVEITNNNSQDLTNYQVSIPGSDLNITSKSESMLITDYQELHTNYFSLKGTDPNNIYYVSINVFDNYNNISKCDINFINNYTALDINNCDNNSTLKFRFGKTLFSDYPETIITKSSESYLPRENIDSLVDSNSYYLHLTHQATDIEKGKKQFNLSKLLERYVNYININGIEEFAKIIIKPN